MHRTAPEAAWLDRIVTSGRVRAGYVSLVGHAVILLLLALLAAAPPSVRPIPIRIMMPTAEAAAPAAGIELGGGLDREHPGPSDRAADRSIPLPVPDAVPPEATVELPVLPADVMEAGHHAATVAMPAGLPDPGVPDSGLPDSFPGPAADQLPDPFAGRRGDARRRGVASRGGTPASEAAVERGLEWLARHQATDGSWRFDLSNCRCDGGCRNPGSVTSTTAATGIALLPFLGAGHTQAAGSHRETVSRGIYYLISRIQASPRGGDLCEGTMYGHGVATLALAEAFGMSRDPLLAAPVGDAVRFIETSQDMHGGGWRYLPGQAGDTTVTAWQIAALKSAALAGVAVPSPTIDAACRFLDRVQVRAGEGYGYLAPQDRSCTSAIGLVCRIYTAWPELATLDRGLTRLARPGPPPEAVYQNFYLAQALLLRDHPAWVRWNARNRDQLVARQARFGHEAGSWSFADPDTAPAGRLGHTALAILTLEVYYRLLPIYGEQAAQGGW